MWKHCDSALRWKGPYCLPPWPTRDRNQAEDRSRLQKIKMTGQGSAPRRKQPEVLVRTHQKRSSGLWRRSFV
eukprot:g9554.t1